MYLNANEDTRRFNQVETLRVAHNGLVDTLLLRSSIIYRLTVSWELQDLKDLFANRKYVSPAHDFFGAIGAKLDDCKDTGVTESISSPFLIN